MARLWIKAKLLLSNAQIFSQYSDQYAKHRPRYPDELFAYLSSVAPSHDSAWDCATGNGQAAVSLAKYFDHVEATDISAQQIEHHLPHPKVRYSVSPAEQTPFDDQAFDLITVATAVHWFDQEKFHQEVGRVLKPGGILAIWSYGYFNTEPEIDAAIQTELLEPIDPFWAAGNRLVLNGYRDLTLPFEELRTPNLTMHVEWNLDQLLAYARTWSAVKRYEVEVGHDLVKQAEARLAAPWGAREKVRAVKMPLSLRVSRKGA